MGFRANAERKRSRDLKRIGDHGATHPKIHCDGYSKITLDIANFRKRQRLLSSSLDQIIYSLYARRRLRCHALKSAISEAFLLESCFIRKGRYHLCSGSVCLK